MSIEFKCVNIRRHALNPAMTVYDFKFVDGMSHGYFSLYLHDANAYQRDKVYTLNLADIHLASSYWQPKGSQS